jgi:hypothetical protein
MADASGQAVICYHLPGDGVIIPPFALAISWSVLTRKAEDPCAPDQRMLEVCVPEGGWSKISVDSAKLTVWSGQGRVPGQMTPD